MVSTKVLQRFLDGKASDAERHQCELLLSDPSAQIEGVDEAEDDRLLETLRIDSDDSAPSWDDTLTQNQRLKQLVAQVEQLVPTRPLSAIDVDRMLSPSNQPGSIGTIGRYEVLELMAAGGMGVVFRAVDPELERPVCLKVMNPSVAAKPQARQRFAREAKASSRLQHERVVTVYEVGEHRDLPYLAMELLAGESLRSRLSRESRLPPATVQNLAIQVAEGLRYAHAHGLLHRDIKPDNIWLTADGNVKILDFGLALAADESVSLTHSGTVLGTPRYMSPEQVQSKPLDSTSDLFSLGIVMFEMLTGQAPFDCDNVFSTLMSVANDPVKDAWPDIVQDLPAPLVQLVNRLLEKQPQDRPQSADELIKSLATLPNQASIVTESNPEPVIGPPSRRWPRLMVGLAGGLLIACLGLLAWQATDKGKLIIEASPDVELSMAKERLKVRDPETGKSYQVRIGDQPLPSGVYQLELEDPDSQLTLSAETIVIRRGKTELVRISLAPGRHDAKPHTNSGNMDATSPSTAGEQNGAGRQSADDSANDPASEQERRPFSLAELAGLDSDATRKALSLQLPGALSPLAAVQQPTPDMFGYDTWTIEQSRPVLKLDSICRLNADGTRIAISSVDEHIRILDEQFSCQMILPSPDRVVDICWSPDPDHLLVVYNGDNIKTALIWRLRERQAQIVQRVPVDARAASWNWTGDRIAFETPRDVRLYDVAASRMYGINVASRMYGVNVSLVGALSEYSWSADGKYLATRQEDAVHTISLVNGKTSLIFAKAKRFAWLEQGSDIVLTRTEGQQTVSELWDVENNTQKTFFDTYANWSGKTLVHAPDFSTHVALKNNGDVAVVARGKQRSVPLLSLAYPNAADHQDAFGNVVNNHSEMSFSRDGKRVLVRAHQHLSLLAPGKPESEMLIGGPSAFEGPVLHESTKVECVDDRLIVTSPLADWAAPQTLLAAELDANDGKIRRRNLGETLSDKPSTGHPVHFSLAPDGSRFATWNPDSGELRVQTWDHAKPLLSYDIGRGQDVQFDWTADGKSLIVARLVLGGEAFSGDGFFTAGSRRHFGSQFGVCYLVFDLSDAQPTVPTLLTESLGEAVAEATLAIDPELLLPCHDGKLYLPFETTTSELTSDQTTFVVEFDTQAKRLGRRIDLGKYRGLDSFFVADNYLVWAFRYQAGLSLARSIKCARLADPSQQVEVSRRQVQRGRSGNTTWSVQFKQPIGLLPIGGGKLLCKARAEWYLMEPSQICDAENGQPHLKPFPWDKSLGNQRTKARNFVAWSPDRKSYAIALANGTTWLLQKGDDNSREFEIPLDGNEILGIRSSGQSWLIVMRFGIYSYSFDGGYLGRWIDIRPSDRNRFLWTPTCWIGQDGAIKRAAAEEIPRDGIWLIGLQGDTIQSFPYQPDYWQGNDKGTQLID